MYSYTESMHIRGSKDMSLLPEVLYIVRICPPPAVCVYVRVYLSVSLFHKCILKGTYTDRLSCRTIGQCDYY